MPSGFGAFGKIPAAGDFFRIDPPPGFVDVWDPWVQGALLAGAERFGGRWDDLYMSMPIWRFTLSAGLAGPRAVLGVLMPSVDRVGRRFPLTLMTAVPDTDTGALHFASAPLFAALEDLALAALDDAMTRDGLAERLAALPAPPPGRALTRVRRAGHTVLGIGTGPLHAGLAAMQIGATAQAQSLWSSEIDGVTRLMLCRQWPGMAELPALFDPQAALWTEEGDA
ncbi:MAG: type VI secretion system-associated protein TagF [Pseudomonadota bacterium]